VIQGLAQVIVYSADTEICTAEGSHHCHGYVRLTLTFFKKSQTTTDRVLLGFAEDAPLALHLPVNCLHSIELQVDGNPAFSLTPEIEGVKR